MIKTPQDFIKSCENDLALLLRVEASGQDLNDNEIRRTTPSILQVSNILSIAQAASSGFECKGRIARIATDCLTLTTDFQQKQMQANGELASALIKLKTTREDNNQLDRALNALQVTIQQVSKLTVIFEEIRYFWERNRQRCEYLSQPMGMELLANDG